MMDRNLLCARVEVGETFDYLLFWGHQQKRPSVVDASCLSQWFAAPFEIEGDVYPTAEHWMMAAKARLFGDERSLLEILKATTPGEAKKLGRGVVNFDGDAWKLHRSPLVVEGNVAKFGQNAELGAFLLSTGDRVLVEASPRDRIWGIGLGSRNAAATDPRRWRGQNLLGFALMEARSALRIRR